MRFSRLDRLCFTTPLRSILPWLAIAALVATRVEAQTTVSVSATANIFGAGFGTPPDPNSTGGGILPTSFSLPNGTTALTFSNVTGAVSFNFGVIATNGPDGGTNFGALTQLGAYNSISGITYNGRTVFLVGVFLDASTPTGSEPATLVYNDTTAGLSSFSPLLRQTFFVGDGLDAGAATQIFNVPSGATRLFLGFTDSWNGSTVTGLPGYYTDNGGTLSVTITAIPEPTTVALWLACGAGTITVFRRRRIS
jgi:hypothetical protein